MSAIQEPSGLEQPTDLSEALLEAARPDLYRGNAFRIIAVPVDATVRDIARQSEKLKMMEKLGSTVRRAGGPVPLDSAPDAYAVREAMQRLHDPERRLIDEFFWFWPHQPGQSRNDEALAALARGDVKTATDLWSKQENHTSQDNISMHNLAVLFHAAALDLEHLGMSTSLSETQLKQRDNYWQQTFKRWKLLIEQEGFWSRLTARIRELEDARLTTGMARRMRTSLPLALLSINAQLAVRAAERGDMKEAERHLAIMRVVSGFGLSVVDEALRQAIQPMRERIKTLCKSAEAEAEADPAHADIVAGRLLDQTRSLLAAFALLPVGNPTRDGAHDEVAICVLHCQIAFGRKTDNWRMSLKLLELALSIASSESTRQRLQEDITIVGRNLESGHDWCGEGYFDLPEPTLSVLEKAHQHAEAERWDEAISLLIELLMGRSQTQIEEQAKRLVHKALAYALNGRAVAHHNRAFDCYNEPTAILNTIAERRKRVTYSFLRTAIEAWSRTTPPHLSSECLVCRVALTGQYWTWTLDGQKYDLCPGCNAVWKRANARQASWSLECMACGNTIYGEYMRWTYRNVPVIICMACNSKQEQEENQRKAELKSAIARALEELLLAEELAPEDKRIKENIAVVRKVTSELQVEMPSAHSARIRLGLATALELAAAFENKNPEVRKAALQALKKVDPELARQMVTKRRVRRLKRFAIAAMVLLGLWVGGNYALYINGEPLAAYRLYSYGLVSQQQATMTWLAALRSGSYSESISALEKLELTDPNWVKLKEARGAISTLVAGLADSSPRVRQLAAEALVKIDPNWTQSEEVIAGVPALVAALKSGYSEAAQEAAAKTLPKIGQAAVPALAAALKDRDWRVRQGAARVLGQIGSAAKEAVPALLAALTDSDSDVRQAAAEALPKMGQAVVPALAAALKDRDWRVRQGAAKALAKIGPAAKEAIPALQAVLRDDLQDVRIAARGALVAIRGK